MRTIEYWDIERKRYPQYEHHAVIIAEDIASRFLNVIGLFNGAIPLIALQLQAIKVGDSTTLVFTKVMDEVVRGPADEDEDAAAAPADRNYWVSQGSQETVQMADQVLEMIHAHAPHLQLKHNKFYIGLAHDGQPNNFIAFRPKRGHLVMELKLPRNEDVDGIIEAAGIDTREYDARSKRYLLRLKKGDVLSKQETLRQLVSMAFDYRNS